ncbi:MAG: hypothetical protein ACKO4W_07065, partial [Bacteroidota bacterium]
QLVPARAPARARVENGYMTALFCNTAQRSNKRAFSVAFDILAKNFSTPYYYEDNHRNSTNGAAGLSVFTDIRASLRKNNYDGGRTAIQLISSGGGRKN